jgi:DtxR family Mn-dependent transcriptional regulator
MPAAGEHHPAFEEYCECIYEMREDNANIIQARLADRLADELPLLYLAMFGGQR